MVVEARSCRIEGNPSVFTCGLMKRCIGHISDKKLYNSTCHGRRCTKQPRGCGRGAGQHASAGRDGGGERTMGDRARAGANKINALVLKHGDTA
jgi:hypothetical protein